jgi:hypothetical protein
LSESGSDSRQALAASMKRLAIVLMATAGLACAAHPADLPTKKDVEQPAPKPNCWGSFWDWLNASFSDCPLTYAGITLYGTLDGATRPMACQGTRARTRLIM